MLAREVGAHQDNDFPPEDACRIGIIAGSG